MGELRLSTGRACKSQIKYPNRIRIFLKANFYWTAFLKVEFIIFDCEFMTMVVSITKRKDFS